MALSLTSLSWIVSANDLSTSVLLAIDLDVVLWQICPDFELHPLSTRCQSRLCVSSSSADIELANCSLLVSAQITPMQEELIDVVVAIRESNRGFCIVNPHFSLLHFSSGEDEFVTKRQTLAVDSW